MAGSGRGGQKSDPVKFRVSVSADDVLSQREIAAVDGFRAPESGAGRRPGSASAQLSR